MTADVYEVDGDLVYVDHDKPLAIDGALDDIYKNRPFERSGAPHTWKDTVELDPEKDAGIINDIKTNGYHREHHKVTVEFPTA